MTYSFSDTFTPGFDVSALVPTEAAAEDEQTYWEQDAGYAAHMFPAQAFADAWAEDSANYPDDGYWSAVEQGMYDDDPNPYHGDYAENDGW